MQIVITGGNGFIAKNLFEQLNGFYSIVICNREVLNLLDADAVNSFLKTHKFDVVIHTATYDAVPKHSLKDPAKILENNLKMFFNITRCNEYFNKMIYFGSGAEFSREHWRPKMSEDYFDKYIPTDQYGFSKYIMTKYTLLSDKIYNLRLFGVFGKYEDWRVRLISNICYMTLMNKNPEINQNKYFDYLYIDDLVRIVKWFIDNNPIYKVYNVCSGTTIDFYTIAQKIIDISNKKLEIIIKIKGLDKEYSGDNSRLLKELNDFRFTPIDKSITTLYRWYEDNLNIFCN